MQLYNKVLLKLAGPETVAGLFAVQGALRALPGVVEATAAAGEATVTYDPEITGLTQLKRTLRDLGYELCSFQFVAEDDLAPCG